LDTEEERGREVVALLLEDSMPADRLGELLRAARKRRGWKRKEAALRVDISAKKLRDYEQGKKPVPPEICAELAEWYGDDLTAHVPLRVPPRLDDQWVVVGDEVRPVDGGDSTEVLTAYVQIVARLRRARAGEALALRAADVVVLAAALNCDAEEIEQRIMTMLGCSRSEAKALHRELLQRKVILPVAGLAASVVALAGFTAAHAEGGAPAPKPPVETTVTTAASEITVPTGPADAGVLPPVDIEPIAPPVTAPPAPLSPPTLSAPVWDEQDGITDSPPPDPSLPDATVPDDELAPDVPRPEIPEDTTPVSIPPGESVVIIGEPDSTGEPGYGG
jgi:transcriptional regulator with XRE-family HTH domain